MYADPNFARMVHEDRRARLEGAATRHRLLALLRRHRAVPEPAPSPAAAPIPRPAALAVVRVEVVAAPGRTPGAADQAA